MTGDAVGAGGADRRWAIGLGVAAAVVALGLGAGVVASGGAADDAGAPGAAPATTAAPPTTRDLATVTDEEMEAVVAENPGVVGMRLALVERYLREGELEAAQRHAEEAATRATVLGEKARALRYLGWTTALLGDPDTGEGILVQSLALDPRDPDGLYFLGRTRYELLDDPAGALVPLEELSQRDMGDEQRQLVDDLLARVRVSLGTSGG